MKPILFFLLVFTLSGFLAAQADNTDQGQKQKASFVREGKVADSPESLMRENSSKKIKISQDGNNKLRKSKVREGMGSAATSGPPQKIKKIVVKQSTPQTDLRKILGNPQEVKKRTPNE